MSKNVDHDLEWAFAAEAVYEYARYMAYGIAPDEYALPGPSQVAEAAREAWELDGDVNLETVAKSLQRSGRLLGLGGPDGLAAKLGAPAVADLDRFVALRRLRGLQKAAAGVVASAERGDLPAALEALAEAQTGAIDAGRAQVVDAFDLGVKLLEAIQQSRIGKALVHPGLEMLQRAAGDLPLGAMTVLGGGTNVGKSGFCLEMLVNMAARGVQCGYVSCEDPESVLSSRLLAVYSGLSSRKLATGTIDPDEWPRLASAYNAMEAIRGKVWFAFSVGGNEIDVSAAMSRLAMSGAKVVVVDYVQAIDSSKRQQDRRNEIRWLCARLKAHAQRLNVHLVLVSQLARPAKGDEHREPTKHDLKEAGDLENAAEYVVLLWREREDDFAPVHVKLAKSKFGNIGSRWAMVRNERTGRLEETSESYESAAKRRRDGKQ